MNEMISIEDAVNKSESETSFLDRNLPSAEPSYGYRCKHAHTVESVLAVKGIRKL